MKYILRAIIYYPVLLTIGLFFELLIGMWVLADWIWSFKLSEEKSLHLFKRYFIFFLPVYYKSYIKGDTKLFDVKLKHDVKC